MLCYYELKIKSYRRYIESEISETGEALAIIGDLISNCRDKFFSKLKLDVVRQSQYRCLLRIIHDDADNDLAYEFINFLYLHTNLTRNFKMTYKFKVNKSRGK